MLKKFSLKQMKKTISRKCDIPSNINVSSLFQTARIIALVLVPLLGFAGGHYLNSIHKTMDALAVSVQRLSESQERLAVSLARVDENARTIGQRVNRNENRLDRLTDPKP